MERVLLVNDSKFESIIMKDILNTIGYDVMISDEYGAAGAIRDFKPDILMANYIMKETRGDQLINIVKLRYPDVRCFLCSSNLVDSAALNSKRIDAFIKTPIGKPELEKILSGTGNDKKADYKADVEKNKVSMDNKDVCSNCKKELFKAGEVKFEFCPFCGYRLQH